MWNCNVKPQINCVNWVINKRQMFYHQNFYYWLLSKYPSIGYAFFSHLSRCIRALGKILYFLYRFYIDRRYKFLHGEIDKGFYEEKLNFESYVMQICNVFFTFSCSLFTAPFREERVEKQTFSYKRIQKVAIHKFCWGTDSNL